MLEIAGLFEVYEERGEHHWELRDWDGRVLARNGGYITRLGAMEDVERLRVIALTANVVEAGNVQRSLRASLPRSLR